MIKPSFRQIFFTLIGLLIAAACTWWWWQNMHRVTEARWHQSTAARQDPLLAASQLLRAEGYQSRSFDSLNQALFEPLDTGIIIIANNEAVMSPAQADNLLAWVAKGGLLIHSADSQPMRLQDAARTAPLSHRLNVWAETERNADSQPFISLPNWPHPLRVQGQSTILKDGPKQTQGNKLLRRYLHGKGQLVLLSQLPFTNPELREYDHAELLIALCRLQANRGPVWLIRGLDMLPWWQALAKAAPWGLLGLAMSLLLWLWAGLTRFGPLQPEPQPARRALLEHIDACGRWLWQNTAGRQLLLDSLRRHSLRMLKRHAPELPQDPARLCTILAKQWRPAELHAAWLAAPAARPLDFLRQVQTLQCCAAFKTEHKSPSNTKPISHHE